MGETDILLSISSKELPRDESVEWLRDIIPINPRLQRKRRQNRPLPEFSEINILWYNVVRYSAHAVSQVENLGRQCAR